MANGITSSFPAVRLETFLYLRILRVQPSGVRSYYPRWGRTGIQVIGKVGEFTPDEARERCQKILGNVAHARPPLDGLDGADGLTLGQFITEFYEPWTAARRPKWAATYMAQLKRLFGAWYGKPLAAITPEDVDRWQTGRIRVGIAPATVQRELNYLASVLTRATKLKKLANNLARAVERPRIDRTPKIRYLDASEEKRLRNALSERDKEMRDARELPNRWRRERKQDTLPLLPHYGDHLTPAVLLSMNTGMRRGELLALRCAGRRSTRRAGSSSSRDRRRRISRRGTYH